MFYSCSSSDSLKENQPDKFIETDIITSPEIAYYTETPAWVESIPDNTPEYVYYLAEEEISFN